MTHSIISLPDQFFITGTDTEVGKTYCTGLMVKYYQSLGQSVFPFKPISAGVDKSCRVDGRAVNTDAYELWLACDRRYQLDEINPIVFQEPIAPHIAAENEGRGLNSALLDDIYNEKPKANRTLIEGAGGWLLPLNDSELLSDWVARKQLPVVLVVGVKLGCLNHALLTAQAIEQTGCRLVGWVANFVQGETQTGRKNVEYLREKLKQVYRVDCLFEVRKGQTEI